MSEKPISHRMIEDMSLRNFGEKTRNDYIRHLRTGCSPDTATAEDLRRFQLHQKELNVCPCTPYGRASSRSKRPAGRRSPLQNS
jgi:hypothetical protein